MPTSLRVAVLGSGVVFLVVATLQAQPAGSRPAPFDPQWILQVCDPAGIFDALDRNKDGLITKDDATDRRAWERVDGYVRRAGAADGRLTREAFLKAYQQEVEERLRGRGRGAVLGETNDLFRGVDRNSDNYLDREECRRAPRLYAELTRWDTNGDGFIASREFRNYIEVVSLEERMRVNPPRSRSEQAPAAGPPVPVLPSWFKELDRDGDAQIGFYEWQGRPQEEFMGMDRNRDGLLTREEVLRSLPPPQSPPARPTDRRQGDGDRRQSRPMNDRGNGERGRQPPE
jgi:Ca2+-binding EF-hand superfamily protein